MEPGIVGRTRELEMNPTDRMVALQGPNVHAGDNNTWQRPEATNDAELHNGQKFSQNARGGKENQWNPAASDNTMATKWVGPTAMAGQRNSRQNATANFG